MGGLDLLPPAKAAARKKSPMRAIVSTVGALLLLVAVGLVVVRMQSSKEEHTQQPVKMADPAAAAAAVALQRPDEPHKNPPSMIAAKALPPTAAATVTAASPPPPTKALEVVKAEPEPLREIISIKLTVAGEPQELNLKLLPQYSESSVAFVRHAANSGCAGELYRSEKDFLVQGRISCAGGAAVPKVVKGGCPEGVHMEKGRACPSHDPSCGCHGPIMGKGMVGWAGGSAGPDLFIYTAHMDKGRCPIGKCEATHWSHDHTVFAEVADEQTWDVLTKLYTLPVKRQGMTFFADKQPFKVAWKQ